MNHNALSTVLRELRVSGAIVLSQAHPIPWAVRVPPGNSLRGYLGVGEDVTVVPFHIAHRGHFDLQPAESAPIVVHANQLVMCANGQGHLIGSGNACQAHTFEEVMANGSNTRDDDQVGATEVVCGVFMLRNTRNNPLIQALPNFVKVDVYGADSSASMRHLHAMLKNELQQSRQGQTYMLERILEMLYAESIRLYTELAAENTPNWLKATNDPRIGPAINHIHANLSEPIYVEQLAELVALSPSRFNACFRKLVGVAPKRYITAQRQSRAARLLHESKLPIHTVAEQCGYQSMPTFIKAFVKQHGQTPSNWRESRKDEFNRAPQE